MAIFSSIADIILRGYLVLVRKCVSVSVRGKIMWMDSIKKKEKLCFTRINTTRTFIEWYQ